MRRDCPQCHQPILLRQRVSLEFLGGDIVCSCGAVLHIRHDSAWIVASVLGSGVFSDVAVFLLILLTAVGAVVWLGWWSLGVAALVFVSVGIIVAALSPLKVVGHESDDR